MFIECNCLFLYFIALPRTPEHSVTAATWIPSDPQLRHPKGQQALRPFRGGNPSAFDQSKLSHPAVLASSLSSASRSCSQMLAPPHSLHWELHPPPSFFRSAQGPWRGPRSISQRRRKSQRQRLSYENRTKRKRGPSGVGWPRMSLALSRSILKVRWRKLHGFRCSLRTN